MGNKPLHTDREIFAQIAAGDEEAYARLFTQYFERLRWYAFKLLKSEFWAEEIVQEVFVHLWMVRDQLPAVQQPSSYLYRMTGNRCLDRIRRHTLEVRSQYMVSLLLHGSGHQLPEAQYDLRRIESCLAEAIDTLPRQCRVIYALQQDEGLSYQEIAERLQISRHTVRNQMTKTLQLIRRHLLQSGILLLCFFLLRSY